MAKDRKSPEQKKQLEYTRDHFTGGWISSRMFPKTWRRKKTRINREYRRKSEELLAQAKPGIEAKDVELIADDLTAARFQKSVIRKRLRKVGTVTVGEKIRDKLERRREAAGRKVQRHDLHDRAAASAVKTLSSLAGEELLSVVHRADLLCYRRNADERKRVSQSKDPIDRALHFLYSLTAGSGFEIEALRRNPELDIAFGSWVQKANRMIERSERIQEEKLEQKNAARTKMNLARNRSSK